MKILKEYLNKNGIDVSADNIDKFKLYLKLLNEYGEKFNLTAIKNENEIEVKHFVDSLAAMNDISGEIIDIGTGAGFPSIPLAIIKKDISFTLVDSLKKRTDFLEVVKKELDLNNIQIFHARAEDFNKNKKFDFSVSRAVAPLNILCEYCLPFIKNGGKMIAYKGSNYLDEIKSAEKAIKVLGGEYKDAKEYSLSFNGEEFKRVLVSVKKVKDTPAIYPRGGNKPRSNPL